MKKTVVFVSVLLLVIAGTAIAQNPTPEPGWNELENPCFENGGDGWEYSENINFGEQAGRPHVAFDPGLPGQTGYLRQVVDNSRSPYWNPDWNHKIVFLWFDLYTTGQGYLKVGFDWWVENYETKPTGEADYTIWLEQEFTSVGEWTTFYVSFEDFGQ